MMKNKEAQNTMINWIQMKIKMNWILLLTIVHKTIKMIDIFFKENLLLTCLSNKKESMSK